MSIGTVTAHDTLTVALRSLLDAGRWPVCTQDPDAWLSDEPDERAEAARWCASCELIEPCRKAGRSEKHGAWGGRGCTGRRPNTTPPRSTKPDGKDNP